MIGIVRVNTPVLPVRLTGPVYFVSHGGEAFPALEVVLQGDGVRVDLVASTFISKAGITSSTFKSTPDVPFSSFELYLPEGRYSALAANGNLCKSKLAMPTAFTAQDGAVIHQSTPITVTGCPKAKRAAREKAKKATKPSGRGQAMNMSKLIRTFVVHPTVVVHVDVHVHSSAGDGAPMFPRIMLPWNMPRSWSARILVLVLRDLGRLRRPRDIYRARGRLRRNWLVW